MNCESWMTALGALILFFMGYRFYSKFLAEKIYQLDPNFRTPAYEFRDGVDYLPTNKFVLWGHHFSSVAGAAPITGPAIAMIWAGTGFMVGGPRHNLFCRHARLRHTGASVRNKGRSIGVITNAVIGTRAKGLFRPIIFFLLLLVNAVFAVVIAGLFTSYPESVLP